jgi:hypothetical protein
VHFLSLRPQCSAGGDPVEDFHALGAGLADDLVNAVFRQRIGIPRQMVEAELVIGGFMNPARAPSS